MTYQRPPKTQLASFKLRPADIALLERAVAKGLKKKLKVNKSKLVRYAIRCALTERMNLIKASKA